MRDDTTFTTNWLAPVHVLRACEAPIVDGSLCGHPAHLVAHPHKRHRYFALCNQHASMICRLGRGLLPQRVELAEAA